MVEADLKDFTTIHPNELLYFQCPLIFDYLEDIIVAKLRTGYSFHFRFQVFFHSLRKVPPADINLFLPKGHKITERLNRRLYANILNIFLHLKREKESGEVTFEDKVEELSKIHGVDSNTLITPFTGVYLN